MKALILTITILTLASCGKSDFNWSKEKSRLESAGATITILKGGDSALIQSDISSFVIDIQNGQHSSQLFKK